MFYQKFLQISRFFEDGSGAKAPLGGITQPSGSGHNPVHPPSSSLSALLGSPSGSAIGNVGVNQGNTTGSGGMMSGAGGVVDAEQAEAVLFLARYHQAQGDTAVAESLCTRCVNEQLSVDFFSISIFTLRFPLFAYFSNADYKVSAGLRGSRHVPCCALCRPHVNPTSPLVSPKQPPLAFIVAVTTKARAVAEEETICLRTRTAHLATTAAVPPAAPARPAGASPGSMYSAAAARHIRAPHWACGEEVD